MNTKGIALISGGLDSLLAVRLILDQGIDVVGVTFVTPFFSAQKAKTAMKIINLPLTILDITEEHLEMLKAPKHGYGKNMNPCIDCHTLMLKIAGRIMETQGADFIFTGEVLGQRPMSQTKQSLHVVAKNSGYQEYILRPLSSKLLPETKPEIEGKVNRNKLLAIQGRGRKDQIELARSYGISNYSAPAGGCLLTDPLFSKRLRDLFTYNKDFRIRDIELLKYGRQFRINETSKVIVGRNRYENEAIKKLADGEDIIITMSEFPGPTTLIPGGGDDSIIFFAASLCALYSDAPKGKEVVAHCRKGETSKSVTINAVQRQDIEGLMI